MSVLANRDPSPKCIVHSAFAAKTTLQRSAQTRDAFCVGGNMVPKLASSLRPFAFPPRELLLVRDRGASTTTRRDHGAGGEA